MPSRRLISIVVCFFKKGRFPAHIIEPTIIEKLTSGRNQTEFRKALLHDGVQIKKKTERKYKSYPPRPHWNKQNHTCYIMNKKQSSSMLEIMASKHWIWILNFSFRNRTRIKSLPSETTLEQNKTHYPLQTNESHSQNHEHRYVKWCPENVDTFD